MKIKVDYFENEIILNETLVYALEIENKKYFYRFVNDLYQIENFNDMGQIHFFDENFKELNFSGQIKIILDFFNFDFDSKKYNNSVLNYVLKNVEDTDREELVKQYNKLLKKYNIILNKVDLPFNLSIDSKLETIIKVLKFGIQEKEELLDNLFLLIDLNKILKINYLLFFVNLKQYLTKDELRELYKYALYNDVKIFLVDSQSYGTKLDYEKKLIIDSNLDEFML